MKSERMSISGSFFDMPRGTCLLAAATPAFSGPGQQRYTHSLDLKVRGRAPSNPWLTWKASGRLSGERTRCARTQISLGSIVPVAKPSLINVCHPPSLTSLRTTDLALAPLSSLCKICQALKHANKPQYKGSSTVVQDEQIGSCHLPLANHRTPLRPYPHSLATSVPPGGTKNVCIACSTSPTARDTAASVISILFKKRKPSPRF